MSLILHNANIITMDYYQPLTDAVVIEDGRIVGIGYDTDVCHGLTAHTRVIDCRGGTLLPGFIDAHCHFLAYAASLLSVDLANASSIGDVQEALRIRAEHLPPNRWLRAVGLDETALAENRAPTRRNSTRLCLTACPRSPSHRPRLS
jgi:predicted amidohydrolase YtcJ